MRIANAYYNIFGRYPTYDLHSNYDDVYMDTHVTICLPVGQTEFTDEDMIRIALQLQGLSIPLEKFYFYQHFMCFDTLEDYFDIDVVKEIIERVTKNNNLLGIRIYTLSLPKIE